MLCIFNTLLLFCNTFSVLTYVHYIIKVTAQLKLKEARKSQTSSLPSHSSPNLTPTLDYYIYHPPWGGVGVWWAFTVVETFPHKNDFYNGLGITVNRYYRSAAV
jgi:hypothetical protein